MSLKRILRFLRITDENDDFSITNVTAFLSMLPVIAQGIEEIFGPTIAHAREGDWSSVGLAAVGFGLYGVKRWRQRRPAVDDELRALNEKLDSILGR